MTNSIDIEKPETGIRPVEQLVMLPSTLTAENGAKAALMGEFYEEVEMMCSACNYDIPQEDCEVCGGEVTWTQRAPVSWTTIKGIYAKAVEHLAT